MKLLQEQIEALDAVKRLAANEDFKAIFQTMLNEQVMHAHAALLSPEVTGQRLEFARARYVATRELANFLKDKEQALSKVIAAKQEEAKAGVVKRIDNQE